jgi:hypothetical protein
LAVAAAVSNKPKTSANLDVRTVRLRVGDFIVLLQSEFAGPKNRARTLLFPPTVNDYHNDSWEVQLHSTTEPRTDCEVVRIVLAELELP